MILTDTKSRMDAAMNVGTTKTKELIESISNAVSQIRILEA